MKSLFINVIILMIFSVDCDSKSDQINNVRKTVLQYFSNNPDLGDKAAIELVANTDWLIEVHLNSIFKNNNPTNSLIESIKQWKVNKLLELNDTSFPSEFYGLGYIYSFGQSKTGLPMIGTYLACAPPSGKVDPIIRDWALKFVGYQMFKIVWKAGNKNFVGYNFFYDTNIMDTDIETVKEIIKSFTLHWPSYPAKSIFYNLNGILVTIIRPLFAALIPNYENIFQFPNTQTELEQVLSLDEVPVHNGGRNTSFVFIPEGVKSGKCLPQFQNYNKQIWNDLRDIRIDCLMGSLKASGKSSLEEFLNDC